MTDTELLDFLIGFANCACDYCVDTLMIVIAHAAMAIRHG